MTVSRRRALALASGAAAGLVLPGTAVAKPPPGKGKPPRVRSVIASDGALGEDVRTIRLTVGTPGVDEQSAVALVAADGETLSGGVQSNFAGNGVWTRRGYSRAHDWTGPKPGGGSYAGFDDPAFIPICVWNMDFSGMTASTMYDRLDDLGINGMLSRWESVSLTDNVTRGKWSTVIESQVATGTISSGDDPGVIGVSSGEEPSTDAEFNAIVADNIAWLAGGDGPGRLCLFNYTSHVINDGFETTSPAEMVLQANGDWITSDRYWIASSSGGSSDGPFSIDFWLYQMGDSGVTQAQCERGSHYGSQVDAIRKHYVKPSGPFGVWIENGAPFTETVTQEITPAQMKWAVWATLVHGARSIHYFNHTFRTDMTLSINNFGQNYYGGPSVAGTGIYAAAKEVNLAALSLAPVINSPFDGYFVFGDVVWPNAESTGRIATTGFLTAVTSTNLRSRWAGVDACCKWYPGDSKHYIFATTREVDGSTNWPVTFRMVDQGQTTATRLFDTTGTISIDRGGAIPGGFCEFSDTFATAASYKAYRID